MTESTAALSVSKLEAARRQIETAVALYFNYGDPVSIHTLSAAAYNIIRDINQKRGGDMMLKDAWQLLETDDAAVFRQTTNQAENFLKHADHDPDGSLDLDPRWAEVFLLEAAIRYYALTGEQTPLMQLFAGWFVTQHPNIFARTPLSGMLTRAHLRAVPSERREYFDAFLPFAMRGPGPGD
jgi:hypothetical protein